ncbi:MAG TPA: hypothetical protein VJK30_02185 [Coxiellaceae bacterium]|nr:MAG: hypothetical protein A3E81_03755 [Gammaproteobacteria bacterium RIFCSPHIGHO2_12_FULL_36_30]HLB56129.1 hypothetical protein [Coxiellaceae bacterium]
MDNSHTGNQLDNAFASIAFDTQGVPYIAYTYSNDPWIYNTVVVFKFDGTQWVQVGGDVTAHGIVSEHALAINNENIPYIIYSTASGDVVKKFNGEGWIQVGSAVDSHHSHPSKKISALPEVGISDLTLDSTGTPIVATAPSGPVIVSKLSNKTNQWKQLGDGGINGSGGLYSLALDAKGIPYIAYTNQSGYWRLHVVRLDTANNQWIQVGRGSALIFVQGDFLNITPSGAIFLMYSGEDYNPYDPYMSLAKTYNKKMNSWQTVGNQSPGNIGVSGYLNASLAVNPKNNAPYLINTAINASEDDEVLDLH